MRSYNCSLMHIVDSLWGSNWPVFVVALDHPHEIPPSSLVTSPAAITPESLCQAQNIEFSRQLCANSGHLGATQTLRVGPFSQYVGRRSRDREEFLVNARAFTRGIHRTFAIGVQETGSKCSRPLITSTDTGAKFDIPPTVRSLLKENLNQDPWSRSGSRQCFGEGAESRGCQMPTYFITNPDGLLNAFKSFLSFPLK